MPGPLLTLVTSRDPAWLPSLHEDPAPYRGKVGMNMSSVVVKNVPLANAYDRVIRWIVMRSARRHFYASISRRGGG
jgi:hypothetical protein